MSDLSRRALIPIALLQFLAPAAPLFGIGEPVGDRATEIGIPPELPLGIFFSIWSIVFLGYLIVGILANLDKTRLPQGLTAPLAAAGLGNVIWMLCAQSFGLPWLDLILLVPILLAIWEAAQRFDGLARPDGWFGHLLDVTIGLFSGWIAVALSISVPRTVRSVLEIGASDYVWLSLWMALVPAALLAWLFASRFARTWWFFAALGWGLTGVAANNWFRLETHALAIATAVVGLYVIWRRARYGARGSAA